MFAEARRPEGAASAVAHDDGVILAGGLKTAAKCRACARTLDVGAPAWFNKDGALGKKITCGECHARKLEPMEAQEAIAEAETKKKAPKRKRVIPKLEPEMLLDREKGLPSVYKAFPKLKFKGKGHEASDLRKLLNKYSEWGHTLLPDMATSEFFLRLEKLGGNHRVRAMVDNIRNVQQGLCTLDEIYDYDLAERVAPEAEEETAAAATAGDENVGWEDEDEMADLPMGAHDEMAGWEDADEMVDLPPPVEVTEEMRERIERNKQEALARAAARKGESGPAVLAEAADEEWEEMAIPGDKEEWTLDAADEEAEQDFFFSAGETVMGTSAPAPSVLPEYIAGGGTSSEELAKRRRLEVAAAEAAALEAGLDDSEEADLIVSCGGVEETQPLPEHAVPEPMVPEDTQPLPEHAEEPMVPEETQPLPGHAEEPMVPEETQPLPEHAEEPMFPEETQPLAEHAVPEPMVPEETQPLPEQAEEPMVPEETQPLPEQAEEPMVPQETQPLVEKAQELGETQALA
ncbi:hypothetical protein AB1Y20_007061 [Prymnesium parvum]|uniref:Chromosome segregation in meiosis protein 3 domain-containing protein n=1 Tax=Prymnesium parvum TaxID=97485 RepID=A0AB34J2C5_PRYPA